MHDPWDEDDFEDEIEIELERNGGFTSYELAYSDGYQAGVQDASRDVEEAQRRKRRAKTASGSRAAAAKLKLSAAQKTVVRNFMNYRR